MLQCCQQNSSLFCSCCGPGLNRTSRSCRCFNLSAVKQLRWMSFRRQTGAGGPDRRWRFCHRRAGSSHSPSTRSTSLSFPRASPAPAATCCCFENLSCYRLCSVAILDSSPSLSFSPPLHPPHPVPCGGLWYEGSSCSGSPSPPLQMDLSLHSDGEACHLHSSKALELKATLGKKGLANLRRGGVCSWVLLPTVWRFGSYQLELSRGQIECLKIFKSLFFSCLWCENSTGCFVPLIVSVQKPERKYVNISFTRR